jgi:hypothetical protein
LSSLVKCGFDSFDFFESGGGVKLRVALVESLSPELGVGMYAQSFDSAAGAQQ